jgi:membrane protease subunit HflC
MFVGAIALIIGLSCVFVVNQTEQAVVLEFKKIVRIEPQPGLKFKMPWQDVEYFDKRVLDYDAPVKTVIAGDLKRLEVDAYVKYRISDPSRFLQTVRSEDNLIGNLDPILESSMRKVISEVPLNALLTEKRDEIMANIKDLVDKKSQTYGIQVADVRIMRADFPEKNRNDIYQRMRSEREREAKTLRARGAEEATKIKAQADKERTVILAEGEQKAQTLKGEGDAEASKIYAEAFSQDAGFYKFYKTMETYKKTISKDDTTVIMSPNKGFFKLLETQE